MSNLNKKIDGIDEYFVSMEKIQHLNVIKVDFPDKWKSFGNKTNTIKTERSEHEVITKMGSYSKPIYWFYGDSKEISFDDINEHIREVIKFNQEIDEKKELFSQKANELKELFHNYDLKVLKTLVFKYKLPKTKTPKKAEIVEEVKVEVVDNNEVVLENKIIKNK